MVAARCQKERGLRRQVKKWRQTARVRACLAGWQLVVATSKESLSRLASIKDYLLKRKTILIIAAMRECAAYQREMRAAEAEVRARQAKRVQRAVVKLWSFNYVRCLDTKGKTQTLEGRLRQN